MRKHEPAMNTIQSEDLELLAKLKGAAKKAGCPPSSLIAFGAEAAEFKRRAVVPNFGPFPHTVDEAPINPEVVAGWPAWVAELVPEGSKWERLHWLDGSITIRLVNHRMLVLAAISTGPTSAL